MSNKAQVELRVEDGQPSITVRVPKGTTLREVAKIQETLFAQPERLGEHFGRVLKGCPNCLSGLRIVFGEDRSNPVVHDIQDMFTNLMGEMRAISTRLAVVERGGLRANVPLDAGVTAVGELEY